MLQKIRLTVFCILFSVLCVVVQSSNLQARVMLEQRRPLHEAQFQFRSYEEYKDALYRAAFQGNKALLKRLFGLYKTLQVQGLVNQGCINLLSEISSHLHCSHHEDCREFEEQLLDICIY